MALLQMPEHNEENYFSKKLNDKIVELENQLKITQAQLAEAREERNLVENKAREAVKLVEQRDHSIRRIEAQVRELHGLARILQKENSEYKAANAQLAQSLTEKQNDLEVLQQNHRASLSNSEVLEKLDALETSLGEMLNELKEEEKAGIDFISRKISMNSEAGFQMKVLSTLNSMDENTAKLRNYNDAKCIAEIERLGRKLDRVDRRVSDSKYVGVLCLVSVGVGMLLAKLFL